MQRGLGLLFLLFLFLLLPLTVRSQVVKDISGWEVLPDSLMQVWHLDKDQMRRIKVIDEDYTSERDEVWSTPDLDDQEKNHQLIKLGAARMEEIKGVLGSTNFEHWQKVLSAAARPEMGN